MRRKLTVDMTVLQVLVEMAEGNPGAASVLAKMTSADPDNAILSVFKLDDMNIRGAQIWAGYKDFAKKDIAVFMDAASNYSKDLVDFLNNHPGVGKERAKRP
jgi:hypothetical protein